MANDIDMLKDIEEYGELGDIDIAIDLHNCYVAKYVEGNLSEADRLKYNFLAKYKFWGNYY